MIGNLATDPPQVTFLFVLKRRSVGDPNRLDWIDNGVLFMPGKREPMLHTTTESLGDLVETSLRNASHKYDIKLQMREALLAGDNPKVIELALQLVGLDDER